jgi:magnesium-transporting ATPase (P-type)
MAKYYSLTLFTSIIVTLIMSTDSSYFNSIQLMYKSFFNTLPLTLLLGMSKSAKQMTKYLNNSNIMDLEHHLVYWMTIVIYAIGLVSSYVYFTQTSYFVPNTHLEISFADGWYG